MAHPTKVNHVWLDITKGLAILWIFLVHFYECFGDAPLFANPHSNWPPINERIAQLIPLDVDGLSGIFINLLRYVGWLGDQGVQIFLVASGFGLVWSSLNNNSAFSIKTFYHRRLVRLFPSWIAAHLIFILTYISINIGLSPADWQTWASLLGLRFIPAVMFYKFPAWWFIGLILQLYIIFPWLFMILQRWSPLRFFLIIGGTAISIRLAGLFLFYKFGHGLGWWSIGGCFLSRLPEFTFGMAFAKWLVNNPKIIVESLNRSVSITCLLCIYLLGNICSFFLLGMSVALLLTGVSFFLLIFVLLSERELQEKGMFARIGRNSYGIYLIHHPIIIFIVPSDLSLSAGSKILAYLITSMISIIHSGTILGERIESIIYFL